MIYYLGGGGTVKILQYHNLINQQNKKWNFIENISAARRGYITPALWVYQAADYISFRYAHRGSLTLDMNREIIKIIPDPPPLKG